MISSPLKSPSTSSKTMSSWSPSDVRAETLSKASGCISRTTSEVAACTKSRSRLRVTVISTDSLEKARHAALESIFGPIAENPNRLGKPLVGELESLWSARRGDYRIIYEIFENEQIVLIHRAQHRRDAYRPR